VIPGSSEFYIDNNQQLLYVYTLVVAVGQQPQYITNPESKCAAAIAHCYHYTAVQLARDEFVVDVAGRDALLDDTVKAAQALRQGTHYNTAYSYTAQRTLVVCSYIVGCDSCSSCTTSYSQ
jgi:hypothetical protein